ncbi:hypothetical protein [Martelella sp. AMO21009]
MAHYRTRIFNAITARLSSIPDFSGVGHVSRARTAALTVKQLPAITATWSERQETVTMRPCADLNGEDGYDRRLPIDLIVHFQHRDPDVEFDRLAVLIEKALGAAIKLDGLVIELTLSECRHYIDRATGISMGVGALTYIADYKTVASDPEAAAL